LANYLFRPFSWIFKKFASGSGMVIAHAAGAAEVTHVVASL